MTKQFVELARRIKPHKAIRIEMIIRIIGISITCAFIYLMIVTIISFVCLTGSGKEIGLEDLLNYYLFGDTTSEIQKTANFKLVVIIHKVVALVITTCYTGLLVAFLLAGRSTILLPSKLVIRFRTSNDIKRNKRLTINCLVGNVGRYILYDTICHLSCNYYDGDMLFLTSRADG